MNDEKSNTLESLEGLLANACKALPPVQNWHPEHTGQIDIRIRRDASWWHEGGEISRLELVKLFSGVLRFDEGNFWLVTPVEKLSIQVDDAPFVVTNLEVLEDENHDQFIVFHTNVDDKVLLNEENGLHVTFDANSGEPSPYVHIRHGLNALISRSVYYELVELGRVQQDELIVSSAGSSFSLGSVLDL